MISYVTQTWKFDPKSQTKVYVTPKISVMKLIEELEETKEVCIVEQWLFYSDVWFDFNVVIRSILYNHEKNMFRSR
jgi:anthranilate/para-aminobenzoate synthase component I